MFNHIKEFFKHSMIYGVSNFITKAVSVVLVPLYVRYLTPSAYGHLEILLITITLLLVIMQMGMGQAIFRSIIYKPEKDEKLIFSTAFYFLIIEGFFIFLILSLFSENLSLLLLDSDREISLINMVFLTVFFNLFSTIPLAYLRINNQSIKFSIIAFIGFIIELSLNILFVVILKRGIGGIIFAGLLKSIIFAFVYAALIRKCLKIKFSLIELKDMLGFGLPMVPAGVALTVLAVANRYFLKYYCTVNEVGIFSLGYRVGMVMGLIVNAFQIAWPSILFSIAKEKQASNIYAKIFTYYLLAISFIGLTISLFAHEIIAIIGTKAYFGSHKIVPFIVLSYIFMGIYYLTSVGTNVKKKTKYEPFIVGIATSLNLLLNYLLIPKYSMMGAAIASVVAFMVMAFLEWRVSNHFYPIHYEYYRITKLILINIVLFIFGSYFTTGSILFTIAVKIMLIISLPLLLFAMNFFESGEIKKLKEILFSHLTFRSSNVYLNKD